MLREGLIRVFGSRQACSFSERLLDLFELREPRFRTRVEFVPLDPGATAAVGAALEVTPLLTPHHASSLAYEVRLRTTGQRVVFSGDTPIYPPLFDRARGADYLVHDCSSPSRWFEVYPILATMHTHALELGRAAAAAAVRCLVPCHFLTGDLEFSVAEVESELRAGFEGRLVMPADFERISL
jgi:ribonuclease BN (tRNA processing enzyme)